MEVIQTTDNQPTELVEVTNQPSQLVNIPSEELLARLEKAKTADIEKAPEAGIKYWEAQKGKEMRGIFLGYKPITAKDGERAGEVIPCPVIQISKYQAVMSAAVQLAGSFQSITPGTAVYVRCDDAKSGQAAQFTVKVLDV